MTLNGIDKVLILNYFSIDKLKIYLSNSILLGYFKKLKRRESRFPGFTFRFLSSRLSTSIVALPSLILLTQFFFLSKSKNILYRPSKRHRNFFDMQKSVLVIGNLSDRKWAKKHGFDFIFFYPLYCLSNFGLNYLWRYVFNKSCAKRFFVSTDYGLDQYLAIYLLKKTKVKSWCIQHGLFPSENSLDLDGADCDVNIVATKFQSAILRRSGYKGKIKIWDNLFSNNTTKIIWKKKLANDLIPVIFVGPGYSYNPYLELRVVQLVSEIQKILPAQFKLIYRPHPRDAIILKKIKVLGVSCDSSNLTSFINSNANFFIGIKSTFLLEAQYYGKKVFLITGNEFPKYFEPGEIATEINIDKLSSILDDPLFKGIN